MHSISTKAARGRRARCALLILFCLLLGAAVCVLSGCDDEDVASTNSDVYVSPYDWNNLVWEGQKLSYREGGTVCSRWGIDVSEHQGYIDWEAVASDGVQFAFVRIGNRGSTEGTLMTDDYFRSNVNGAQRVGIEVNTYFFSQALDEIEAIEEAEYALALLDEMKADGITINMVAYDHEAVAIDGARANDISATQFAQNAFAFCETIRQGGYEPMIYGNQRELLRIAAEERRTYPFWLAQYEVEHPTAPLDFVIWQYTNAGTVSGIDTQVDLNIWMEQ